jgi:predicted Zn-dependent peptidase
MIQFNEFTLSNGLKVIVHEDPTVQIAVMNILYDVGCRVGIDDRSSGRNHQYTRARGRP